MELEDRLKVEKVLSSVRMKDLYKNLYPDRSINGSLCTCPSPLHADSTPSCKIYSTLDTGNPDTLYCFGCGFSGNVVSVLAKIRQISYEKATDQLMEMFNIEDTPLSFKQRFAAQRLSQTFERNFEWYMSQFKSRGIVLSLAQIEQLQDIYDSQDLNELRKFYREVYADNSL